MYMCEIQFRPECSQHITLVAYTIDIILRNRHTFAINSFTGTKPRTVLLVKGRGWLLYSALAVLGSICAETFCDGCLLLSGVSPRHVFVFFLHIVTAVYS